MSTLQTSSPVLPQDPGVRPQSFPGPADSARSSAAYAAIASPSIGDTAWAAFEGTIPALIGNQISRQGFMPDPTYTIDDKLWKSLTDGIDPDLWKRYFYTVSADHAKSMLIENRLEMERRKTLAAAGMGGQAAQIVAGITDPAMFLATVGTAGAAGGLRLTTTAGRIGSLIEGGVTAGVPMVALESYRASQDPSVRTSDIVAAGLGGFGLGMGAAATQFSGRAARFAAGGFGQAIPTAFVNSAMGDDEHRNAWSGLAANFVLGGVGNAIHATRKPPQAALAADLEAVARTAAKDMQVAEAHAAAQAAGVTPSPTASDLSTFRDQLAPDAVSQRGAETIGQVVAGHNDDASALGLLRASGTTKGLGAASPETIALPIGERNPLEDLDLSNLALDPAKASKTHYVQIGGTRVPVNTWGSFGMAEFLGSSESTAMRRFGKAFGYDPIPDQSNAPVLHSAPIWANERAGIKTSEAIGLFRDSYTRYADRLELTGAKPMSQDEFYSQVTQAKRRINSARFANFEPEIQQAAREWVKPVDDLLKLQQRHNVPASENVPQDSAYVANVWNRAKLDQWVTKDRESLRSLFREYVRRPGEKDSKLLDAMADAFIDHAGANSHDPLAFQKIQSDPEVLFERLIKQNPAFNTPEILSQLKSQMQAPVEARLERALSDLKFEASKMQDVLSIARDLEYRNNYIRPALERLGWDPAVVDAAIEAVKTAATDNGNPVQMRRRYHGNIDAETVATDGTKLRIEDFLVNDARTLANIMNRRAYGAAAFHGAMRALTPEHVLPPRTIPEALRDLQAQMRADGLSEKTIAQELKYAETLMKHTSGIPLNDSTWATRAMRTMMNAQSFLRMTNARVGFQNGLEINRTIARYGVKATMEQLPALKEIWKETTSGKLNNRLLREMRTLVGQDFDAGIRKALIDAEDAGKVPTTRAERLAAKGAGLAGTISGTNLATEFAVRGTEAIIAQRIVDIARSGKMPSKERLAASGLHDWQAERLMKSIRDEIAAGTVEMQGSRLVAWNYDRWADQESLSWLRSWASLETRNLIQRGDASGHAQWMTKPIGDLLIQFRKWGMFAHRNHLLYNLNAADTAAVRESVASFAFGALIHLVAVAEGVMLLDAAEREKYLESKLSAEGIAIGAFSRAGWSAMMPAYWDAARSVAGREPTFAYVRASGLSDGGGLLSNPTIAWMNSAANLAVRTPQSLFMDDRQLSQKDVRNFTNTFIPNIFGLKNGLNALLGENLPKESVPR